ncbi:hypothetical protein SAMN05421759_1096 [Roseivivax lentus]|uniref:Repeat domain-containing protein n=1 Tax=Roseivivax lentus TaxID=633194 RepID=A0A1N7NLM2_9RHOB|nr:hypothetical protein [Roseivivax lentus]SIS99293.1 hypothetical protein SAMN05421759_1096 [Roseivivax lentus]
MKPIALSACAAFFAVAEPAFSQESDESSSSGDEFSEAVDQHFDSQIKKKIRQNLTERLLDEIANEKLNEITKKIPGIIANNTPAGKVISILSGGAKMAFTISPAGPGSDMSGSCASSEGELFQYFSDRFGGPGMAANNAVISLANQGTTDVISKDPFKYLIRDSEFCEKLSAWKNPAPTLSNAARYLVQQHIHQGCEGRSGSFSEQGITITDLDGDGRDDLILSDEWIECEGAQQQSKTCGTKVCEAIVYMRRGSTLDRVTSFNGTGIEVGHGERPTVSFLQHDLSNFKFGWDGNQFRQR